MLSRELEDTLRRAMSNAASRSHEFATLEHLLVALTDDCLLYTSPSPRDQRGSRMPSSA